jgi:transposase
MNSVSKFVALDVHKETLSVAVATVDRRDPESLGTITNTSQAISKLVRKLGRAEELFFCYEAGPCGYSIYRQLTKLGAKCIVVAPSLIPKSPGDRVKTDRRDALKLARLLRSGDLEPIWVPDDAQEALRDLSRAREAAQQDLVRKRNQLVLFLLRLDIRPPEGLNRWTARYKEWLTYLHVDQPAQELVLAEYRHAVHEAEQRVERLEAALAEYSKTGPLAPVIAALQCLRGVGTVTSIAVAVEMGDLTRFPSAKQAMDYVGVVPSEYSSGGKQHRGSITHAGNAHVRYVLVEAAQHYRHQPNVGRELSARQQDQPEAVKQIAWKAQRRLHDKFRRMVGRGKAQQIAVVAVARELVGFIWAIAREVALSDTANQTSARAG